MSAEDEKDSMTTYGFGWCTEANEDPLPGFVALHRWLLDLKYDNLYFGTGPARS